MSMQRLAALALAGLCIAATACSGDDTAGTADVASATTTSSPAPATDATTATTTAAAPTTAVDLCPYRVPPPCADGGALIVAPTSRE